MLSGPALAADSPAQRQFGIDRPAATAGGMMMSPLISGLRDFPQGALDEIADALPHRVPNLAAQVPGARMQHVTSIALACSR